MEPLLFVKAAMTDHKNLDFTKQAARSAKEKTEHREEKN